MNDFKHWTHLAETADDEALKREIDISRTFAPCQRAIEVLARINPATVLDFGCGLGRNVPAMLGALCPVAVTLYDSGPMIERVKTRLGRIIKPGLLEYVTDLSDKRFDAVLATLVLQHIDRPDIGDALERLASMTTTLVVYGRRHLDDGGDTWSEVHQYFELTESSYGDDRGHYMTNPGREDHHVLAFQPKR